eukprot:RCo039021
MELLQELTASVDQLRAIGFLSRPSADFVIHHRELQQQWEARDTHTQAERILHKQRVLCLMIDFAAQAIQLALTQSLTKSREDVEEAVEAMTLALKTCADSVLVFAEQNAEARKAVQMHCSQHISLFLELLSGKFPGEGLRSAAARVLANVTFECTDASCKIVHDSRATFLLECSRHLDETNPCLEEWAAFAIRNISASQDGQRWLQQRFVPQHRGAEPNFNVDACPRSH